MSFVVEGLNQLSVQSQIKCTQSLDSRRQRILPGEEKMRSISTRSYTAHPRLGASDYIYLGNLAFHLMTSIIVFRITRTENVTQSAMPAVLLFRKLELKFSENTKCVNISEDKMFKNIEEVVCTVKEKLNEACLSLVQEFNKVNTSHSSLFIKSPS
ncbi:uncharacterized protein LOC143775068 [Ranitomeya variabilis]|uniref:uncharacterized protein LOC143775068 n=1 Tax=Ranitomeya variabilis TaxID=490064 RepID=UPI004055F41C